MYLAVFFRSPSLTASASRAVLVLWVAAVTLLGQQGAPQETGATAAATPDCLENFTWHPGGTREEDMWRVLILFGVGDGPGESWDGYLAVESGEIPSMDPHRQEPPDRILPNGGWRLTTQDVTILLRSTVVPRPEPAFQTESLPKGLWVRGSGSSATTVSVSTVQGDFTFQPMALDMGPWSRAGWRCSARLRQRICREPS